MNNTPRTDAMIEESWHKINTPVCPVPGEFAKQLERELAEANHLRERAESSLSGAAARMRAAQDESEAWQTRWGNAIEDIADLQRSAKLENPLHDILDEMDSRGGNAIRKLTAYIRACDPERKEKAKIAFRDDLECYDRKLHLFKILAAIPPPTTHPETPVV
jgi:hypothetical protein